MYHVFIHFCMRTAPLTRSGVYGGSRVVICENGACISDGLTICVIYGVIVERTHENYKNNTKKSLIHTFAKKKRRN